MFCFQGYLNSNVETEVDPLEERLKEPHLTELMEDLSKRVSKLEQKVEELIVLEENMYQNPQMRLKKRRRKF